MQLIISVLVVCFASFLIPHAGFAQSTGASSSSSPKPLRVLLIGNSYTYYNGMPSTLAALATASGQQPIEVKVKADGGATLEELGSYGLTKDLIAEGNWDFVVLQEQSLLPIRNPEKMYRAGRDIDAEIKKGNANAKTILFLTWARRSQPKNQQRLDQAYTTLGKELNARVAPVGPAWQLALSTAPTISLYADDGSHPSPTGSYLAACVIYLTVVPGQTQCPALELNGVSAEHAEAARKAAAAVVAERR